MFQHSYRKKGKPKQEIQYEGSLLDGGLVCDLSVKFNASRLPLNSNSSDSKNNVKNVQQKSPKICEDFKEYLRDFTKSMSRDELSDYIVQLLLNFPPNSVSETNQIRHQNGSAINSNCVPKDSLPSPSCSVDSPHRHRPSCGRSGRVQSRNDFVGVGTEGTQDIHQDRSRGIDDQSDLYKIISAVKFLCDCVWSLDDQSLNGSVEQHNVNESRPAENNSLRNVDKRRERGCRGSELCNESCLTKSNKRVQTDEYRTPLMSEEEEEDNNFDKNCYTNCHGNYFRRRCYFEKGSPGQASSYGRCIKQFGHLQPPRPLTPPQVHLNSFTSKRSDNY